MNFINLRVVFIVHYYILLFMKKIIYSETEVYNRLLLKRLLNNVGNITEDTFIGGIHACNRKENFVRKLTAQIGRDRMELQEERINLEDLAENFHLRFSTDDNTRYDDEGLLLLQIHNSVNRLIKDVLSKFLPHTRKPQIGNVTVSVLDRSMLVDAGMSKDLFGFDGYEPCVKELYDELDLYTNELLEALNTCNETIKKVELVRQDENVLNAVYKNSYMEAKEKCSLKIRNNIMNNRAVVADEMSIDFINAADYTSAQQKWYHKSNLSGLCSHVEYMETSNSFNADMTELEKKVFGIENYSKCKYARYIMKNLDKIAPKGKGKKIDASFVWALFAKLKLPVLKDFYDWVCENNKSQFVNVGYTAVSSAHTNLTKQRKEEEKYTPIIENLLESYNIN